MSPLLNFWRFLVNLKVSFSKGERYERYVKVNHWRSSLGTPSGVLLQQSLDGYDTGRTSLAEFHARGVLHGIVNFRRSFVLGILISFGGIAQSNAFTPSPYTHNCTWESIGAKYGGLNPYLLYAIAKQESGLNPKVVSRPNANGTVDIGLMQINSAWLPTLLSRFGITKLDLFRSCVNLDVGAWILYENFKTYGYSWRAIGAYNAKSEDKRLNYVRKVYRHIPPELKILSRLNGVGSSAGVR